MSIPFNKADWLHNGCQSEKIAKCAAAAHAHEAITTIAAFHADETITQSKQVLNT